MAAPQGESDVAQIKAELEEQEQDFRDASADLGDYDASIDAALEEAHSAVDGSGQKDVEELFKLGEEAKAILNGLSGKADESAQKVREINDRL